ncbi:hypothetical protein CC78DRAFT_583333 [Lojkania enalia]|uniref:N-acetyltransferase domain-containing protein n=1 Tax=Lojkania enalia TaxID=147567 RepID=A0A9P4K993_9PLEO|nr:hypothetical protein CC78DRAFT_583333 [Didymosphaeria enalia]
MADKTGREYIPPHLRKNGTAQQNDQSTPPAHTSPEYIPPHLRNKNGTMQQNDQSTPRVRAPPQVRFVTLQSGQQSSQQNDQSQGMNSGSSKPNKSKTVNHRPTSPPSPPSSPTAEQAAANAPPKEKHIVWGEWNDSPLDGSKEETTGPRGKGLMQSMWNSNNGPRWPKSLGPRPKKLPWPKNRDMRPQPTDSNSDGGVTFKSESNGDPDYDIKKLVDWNGDWLPAPVEWQGRKCFTDRHFGDHIEAWIHQCDKNGNEQINTGFAEFLANKNSDLAPTSWIPAQIEGNAPQQFWNTFSSCAPEPLNESDLGELPWWETYINEDIWLLPTLEVPDAQLDLSNEENHHPGVAVSSGEAVRRKAAAAAARARKLQAKRNKPTPVAYPPDYEEPSNRSLKPTENIYLRPVRPSDISQVAQIYNYYVDHTIKANEFESRTASQIAGRINDITSRGLPWIVAILRGRRAHTGEHNYVTEEVVGFIDLDDYCDQGSMYRFTFEMELYIHPFHQRRGVGKCLIDKLLDLVDTGYKFRGGYPYINTGEYLKNGPSRVVKMINCSLPHEAGETDELMGFTSLLKEFNFRRSGHLKQMGYKYGKIVDVSVFQYETKELIEANNQPDIPL